MPSAYHPCDIFNGGSAYLHVTTWYTSTVRKFVRRLCPLPKSWALLPLRFDVSADGLTLTKYRKSDHEEGARTLTMTLHETTGGLFAASAQRNCETIKPEAAQDARLPHAR